MGFMKILNIDQASINYHPFITLKFTVRDEILLQKLTLYIRLLIWPKLTSPGIISMIFTASIETGFYAADS